MEYSAFRPMCLGIFKEGMQRKQIDNFTSISINFQTVDGMERILLIPLISILYLPVKQYSTSATPKLF